MSKEFRLIVAGSREFAEYATLEAWLDRLLSKKVEDGFKIIIICGGAKVQMQLENAMQNAVVTTSKCSSRSGKLEIPQENSLLIGEQVCAETKTWDE